MKSTITITVDADPDLIVRDVLVLVRAKPKRRQEAATLTIVAGEPQEQVNPPLENTHAVAD